ncbi:MAG: hypothetical protein NTW96_20800 [Planctomycetia bacterium]|nr:hypothetical protein [Planctomycetia bacterium]
MCRAILLACLPWAGLLVALVVLLWGLTRLNSARLELGRLRVLHHDEGGAAQSLSFVLTLPFFVMIMLFILQVSQVMIGTVVVHYAAFAAARSAVVWIPARLGMELENCIGVHVVDPGATDQVPPSMEGPTPGGLTFLVDSDGPKFQKIRAAAVMATMPICPSRDLGLTPSGTGQSVVDTMNMAYQAMAPGSAGRSGVPRRMRNKLAYAEQATRLELRFYHRNTDAPHWPVPPAYYVSPDPAVYFLENEMDWQDDVTVTLYHEMALLPGPGRFLSRLVTRADGAPDEVARSIHHTGNVYTYPLKASITLGNEGEKSVIPYAYSAY